MDLGKLIRRSSQTSPEKGNEIDKDKIAIPVLAYMNSLLYLGTVGEGPQRSLHALFAHQCMPVCVHPHSRDMGAPLFRSLVHSAKLLVFSLG